MLLGVRSSVIYLNAVLEAVKLYQGDHISTSTTHDKHKHKVMDITYLPAGIGDLDTGLTNCCSKHALVSLLFRVVSLFANSGGELGLNPLRYVGKCLPFKLMTSLILNYTLV